jgi:Na+/proline symporter
MPENLRLLTTDQAYLYLAIFAIGLILITTVSARLLGKATVDSFLVAKRRVPWWLAGPSIAAGWTWAIALMVSVQSAYQNGLAGIFWFTVPNIIAVFLYIWLGPRIRNLMPSGYSLPEWIHVRFGDNRVTVLYAFVYFYYQVMAVAVQLYACSSLLSLTTGLNPFLLMLLVLGITLFYCIFSGLQASLITDLLQLSTLLTIGAVIVWMVYHATHGQLNLHGTVPPDGINPFTPAILFTAGVIQTIGLFSGSIGDQPFWQRSLAIRDGDIKKAFVFGGLLFGLIPIGLSILGFTAAVPQLHIVLPAGSDPSLIGFAVVKNLLPPHAATFFVFMLAALCSSLDSALVAASSLYRLIWTRPWRVAAEQRRFSVGRGRIAMIAIGCAGLLLAAGVKLIPGFDLKYLWWLLNTIGACVVVPTVLSLFWDRLSARGMLTGTGLSLCLGLPLGTC